VSLSPKKSTPEKRTLILWALLVTENAAAFQNELKPEPDKADREALEGAGLIKVERRGRFRRYWIEVTKQGWEWAGRNLGAALPANSPAGSKILQAWLTRIQTFIEARGIVLEDLLERKRLIAPPPPPADDYATLRGRIREAYLDVTGGRFNERVLLSILRNNMRDVDSRTLDDTLRKMHLEEGTTLSGLNNPQEITQAIRDAAVNFKGEPMYALWITR
jgi:hypothetical protein